MSSLFSRTRFSSDLDMLKLPHFCETGGDAESLQSKREAQLKWMKEHGVRYLGGPSVKHDRRAPRPPSASVRTPKMAIERPGDAIVRDLASNDRTGDAITHDLASNG